MDTGAATVGVVARDHLGYPVMVASLPIDTCNSAEEAEARAILTGLKLAIEHELKVTKVESDCATAVKNTNCMEPVTSSIWSVYRDVNYARSLLSRCEVVQIGRKRNGDAHGLAKLAVNSGEASVWLPPIPVAVIELCNQNIVSDVVNI
jgi:ribonuclease HI